MRLETALLRRVIVGGNRCAQSAGHRYRDGCVAGCVHRFSKGRFAPPLHRARAVALQVRVHWLTPPGLHQVGRPNPNGFGWTIPPAGAAIFSKGALRAGVYFEGGSARPTEALRNKPSVSCVGREQGHSCANALGACCCTCVGCCRGCRAFADIAGRCVRALCERVGRSPQLGCLSPSARVNLDAKWWVQLPPQSKR